MSDNKTLLKESTIRRFMKLASIDTLSENFIDQKATDQKDLEEGEDVEDLEEEAEPDSKETEKVKEGMGMGYDRDVETDVAPPTPEGLPPAPEGELDDAGMEDGPAEDVEASVTVPEADIASLRTARDVITQILGASEEGEGEPELEPGLEPELEPEPGMEPAPEDEDVVPMQEDEDQDGLYEYNDEDLVQEVSRRVAARIKHLRLSEKKEKSKQGKEKMAEALAEKIFKRLSKKKK